MNNSNDFLKDNINDKITISKYKKFSIKRWILKTFFKKELQIYIKEIQLLQTRIQNYKNIIKYNNDKITELKGLNYNEKHFLR